MKRIVPLILLVALAAGVLSGCSESPDQRQAALVQQALEQQARQTERLMELSQQIGAASRQLITADSEARRELLATQGKLQQQLQAQQADVLRQRDELEQERRALATQRGRDPIVAQAIGGLAVTLGCLFPLLLAAYIWSSAQRGSADAEALVDYLTSELVSDEPTLLRITPAAQQLEHLARP
jgi:hypothetical protein